MGVTPGDSQQWFLFFKRSEKKIVCPRQFSFSYHLLVHKHLSRQDFEFLDPPYIHSYICRHVHCTLFFYRYMLLLGHILKTGKDLKKKICLRQSKFSYLHLLVHKHLSLQDFRLLDPPYIHSYICRHLRCTLFFHRYMWLLGYMLKTGKDLKKKESDWDIAIFPTCIFCCISFVLRI